MNVTRRRILSYGMAVGWPVLAAPYISRAAEGYPTRRVLRSRPSPMITEVTGTRIIRNPAALGPLDQLEDPVLYVVPDRTLISSLTSGPPAPCCPTTTPCSPAPQPRQADDAAQDGPR